MAKKKSGNAKRSISKVKRNNQRKNKLIKRGELKPKRSSTTPYLEKQASKDFTRLSYYKTNCLLRISTNFSKSDCHCTTAVPITICIP